MTDTRGEHLANLSTARDNSVENPDFVPLGLPLVPGADLSMFTDRELWEASYRLQMDTNEKLTQMLTIISELREMAEPFLSKLAENPLVKSLIGG